MECKDPLVLNSVLRKSTPDPYARKSYRQGGCRLTVGGAVGASEMYDVSLRILGQ